MKKILISFFALTVFLLATPARAEAPVTVVLYKADPTAKEGFTEEYRWRMGHTDEWRRFEYLVGGMSPGKNDDINPFQKKPQELLVLSVKDANGVTGKDYYFSKDGIMVTAIHTRSKYFDDDHNFMKLLKEEVDNRSSFETFPGEKIATDAKGILVRYNINEDLPNPSWLINRQKDINLYDSFLRGLTPSMAINRVGSQNSFEQNGNYILLLNYPKAPAKLITVGADGIRMSDTYSNDTFFKDDKNYFKFFRDLTIDTRKMQMENQAKDKSAEEKGQF